MGNGLKSSLVIIRGTSCAHLEAVRDHCAVGHFGCRQGLSSGDGIVPGQEPVTECASY